MDRGPHPFFLPLNHSTPDGTLSHRKQGEAVEWRSWLGQKRGTGQVREDGKVRFQRSQQLGRKRQPQSQASWRDAAGPGSRDGQPSATAALSGLRQLPGVSEPVYFQHLGM